MSEPSLPSRLQAGESSSPIDATPLAPVSCSSTSIHSQAAVNADATADSGVVMEVRDSDADAEVVMSSWPGPHHAYDASATPTGALTDPSTCTSLQSCDATIAAVAAGDESSVVDVAAAENSTRISASAETSLTSFVGPAPSSPEQPVLRFVRLEVCCGLDDCVWVFVLSCVS